MPSHGADDSVPGVPLNTKEAASILAVVATLTACGSDPRLRVNDSVLERITIENKLLLFDAENELDIAIDDRDQVLEAQSALREERGRVVERWVLARRDVSVFQSKGDATRSQVASLRADVAQARLRHIDARLEAEQVRLERQRRALLVARARFELAKARLVKRNNVPGAASLQLEAFERQVSQYEALVGALDPKLDQADARVAEREEAWSMAAARLRDASGGAYGSRWLD